MRRLWSLKLPLLIAAASAVASVASGAGWKLSTSIDTSLLHTDNVELVSRENARSDFVIQVSPLVSLRRSTDRAELALSYRLESIKFAELNEQDRIQHSARLSGSLQVIPRRLFVDADIEVGRGRSIRNLYRRSGSLVEDDDEFDIVTYRLEPELYAPIGDNVAHALRYRLQRRQAIENTSINTGADNTRHELRWDVSNRPQRSNLQWDFNLRETYTDRPGDNNSTRLRSVTGATRYFLSDSFALMARAGREENRFSGINVGENGNYWSVGAFWLPLDWVELGGFWGPDDKQAQITLFPNQRTVFQFGVLDRDLGVDASRRRISGTIFHRAKRSVFRLGYEEDVTDDLAFVPEVLLPGTFDSSTPGVGSIPGLPGFGLRGRVVSGEFLRQRWQLNWNWGVRRNRFSVLYNRDRLLPLNEQGHTLIHSGGLRFRRTHYRRAFSEWFAEWNGLRFDEFEDDSDQYRVGYRFERAASRWLRMGFEYAYTRFDGAGELDDYHENRVTAYIRTDFGRGNVGVGRDLPRGRLPRPGVNEVIHGIPNGNNIGGSTRFSRRSPQVSGGQSLSQEANGGIGLGN